jgi:rhodanese-related sulfurtransferase
MKLKLKLENRQIGIFAVLIIAFIMLLLPGQDKSRYAFKPDAIAGVIKEGKDHVSPGDLSQWIIEGKNDFTLVDIRSKEEFEKGHIKGAKNIPLDTLLKRSTVESEFVDGKMVILYSNGTSHAAQAWLVLKTAGIDCYILDGGYNYWNETVLNPKNPGADAANDEVLKYQAAQSVADYFGGSSQMKSGAEAGKGGDTGTKAPVKREGKKKKLQGC